MESNITCLNPDCQKNLDIPDWVNFDSYDGEVVCRDCGARLAIKFKGSKSPAKYRLLEKPQPKPMKVVAVDAETGQNVDLSGIAERTRLDGKTTNIE